MLEGNIYYNNGFFNSDKEGPYESIQLTSFPFNDDEKDSYESNQSKLISFHFNDEFNILESEQNIGIRVPPISITKKIDNSIKQRYHFEYGPIHKERNFSNSNDAISPIFKMRTPSKTEQEKYERQDNCRRIIGRDVFNQYLKHEIEKFIRDNKLILCFEKFPKEFIFKVTNKKNKLILDKTIEELIESKDLYNDIKPKSHFDNNLKVIKIIKENENKCKDIININENNFDNFLKKNYRDLIKDYSHSIEYEQKVAKIKSKEGIKEANKYIFFTEKFIENYKN